MTIRERLKATLVDRGLWEEEANSIMDRFVNQKTNEPMSGRWDQTIETYQEALVSVLMIGLDEVASDWLKQNAPNHWARPMFHTTAESID